MKVICGISICAIILGLMGVITACLFRNPRVLQYPLRASCNITWYFEQECNRVAKKLVRQIDVWKTDTNCGTGQRCLYALVSEDENELKATHETPMNHITDDLTYKFYSSPATGGCNVIGFSASRIWYTILDSARNYCNLHNLVDGAGLRNDPKYTEITRDELCTQYTGANCDKY